MLPPAWRTLALCAPPHTRQLDAGSALRSQAARCVHRQRAAFTGSQPHHTFVFARGPGTPSLVRALIPSAAAQSATNHQRCEARLPGGAVPHGCAQQGPAAHLRAHGHVALLPAWDLQALGACVIVCAGPRVCLGASTPSAPAPKQHLHVCVGSLVGRRAAAAGWWAVPRTDHDGKSPFLHSVHGPEEEGGGLVGRFVRRGWTRSIACYNRLKPRRPMMMAQKTLLPHHPPPRFFFSSQRPLLPPATPPPPAARTGSISRATRSLPRAGHTLSGQWQRCRTSTSRCAAPLWTPCSSWITWRAAARGRREE